jgi:hypothetical protein
MLGRYPITWSQNRKFWFWVVRIELELGLKNWNWVPNSIYVWNQNQNTCLWRKKLATGSGPG